MASWESILWYIVSLGKDQNSKYGFYSMLRCLHCCKVKELFSPSHHGQAGTVGIAVCSCCLSWELSYHGQLPCLLFAVVTSDLSSCSLFWSLAFPFRLGEGSGEPNVPEMPRKWEPWMNSWAYWSTGSLCILTFIISVGCWCSWLMGPGAVHPSLHINYWRGVFPVIYLTAGCDKYL